jgi:mediator of RNA polymerase II transcription subunit 12
VCALRYGVFLLVVDRHLPHGLDDQVLQWFLGTGRNEVAALTVDAWELLTLVLMYLSVHGALRATTILRGLVYPAWQLGSNATSEHSLEVFLTATNHIFYQLLFCEHGSVDSGPPVDLLDVQRIRARRQQVYQEPHFSTLLASIPNLILIEHNHHLSDELRRSSRSLRYTICTAGQFRQGGNRNLDVVQDAFEHRISDISDEHIENSIIDGLGLIFCDTELSKFRCSSPVYES